MLSAEPIEQVSGPHSHVMDKRGRRDGGESNPPTAWASASGQMFRCRAKTSAKTKPATVVATMRIGLGMCAEPKMIPTRSELRWRFRTASMRRL